MTDKIDNRWNVVNKNRWMHLMPHFKLNIVVRVYLAITEQSSLSFFFFLNSKV